MAQQLQLAVPLMPLQLLRLVVLVLVLLVHLLCQAILAAPQHLLRHRRRWCGNQVSLPQLAVQRQSERPVLPVHLPLPAALLALVQARAAQALRPRLAPLQPRSEGAGAGAAPVQQQLILAVRAVVAADGKVLLPTLVSLLPLALPGRLPQRRAAARRSPSSLMRLPVG